MENVEHWKDRAKYVYDLLKEKANELGLKYAVEVFKRESCVYLMVYIETPKIEFNNELNSLDVEEFKSRNKIRSEFSKYILHIVRENDLSHSVKFSYPPVLPETIGVNYFEKEKQ